MNRREWTFVAVAVGLGVVGVAIVLWLQEKSKKPAFLTSCDYLESTAAGLEASGIPISSGMTCDELRVLMGCGRPHSAAAQIAYDTYCTMGQWTSTGGR